MNGWMDRAACRDVDPEIFFPIGTGMLAERYTVRAKAVCQTCTAREACLRWALHHGQDDGVWGGLDADERRELRRCRPGGPGSGGRLEPRGPTPRSGRAGTVVRPADAAMTGQPGAPTERS